MKSDDYNHLIEQTLEGRFLHLDYPPAIHLGKNIFLFWGYEAGIPSDDIHHNRVYRINIQIDDNKQIIEANISIDGDLISPCSGYTVETLDQFDYPYILKWCLNHTSDLPN